MSMPQSLTEVVYPESDGRPMGETELHRFWMVRVYDLLKFRYRGQRVYVASDLLMYYEEGNPRKFVVPDDFVVLDSDPQPPRRVYKVWEEGKGPDTAFEITSQSTRVNDTTHKPKVFARIGVKEYFMFDPTADYLNPPLQGFRLEEGEYRRIEPDSDGFLRCETLGLLLRLERGRLVLYDAETGDRLQTRWEFERERASKEARRADEEAHARAAAEKLAAEEARRADAEAQARQALEEELRRLREQLKDRDEKTR